MEQLNDATKYIEKAEGIVRRVLGLDSGIYMTKDTRPSDLNANWVETLEIFRQMNVNLGRYTSGGTINKMGKRVLKEIADSSSKNQSRHFLRFASNDANYFHENYTIEDLAKIAFEKDRRSKSRKYDR